MKISRLLFLTIFLNACGSEKEPEPDVEGVNVEVVEALAVDRKFAAKLDAILEQWVGTPWAYSGTSQEPGSGSIACGYFVTTALEDAGIKLDRIRLAQAASETMILAITSPESVKRYSDVSLETFLDRVRSQGEGFYIVGLDNHTGFLNVQNDGEIEFVHSGPGRGVVREKPFDAPELANSRYRVTGKIGGAIDSSMLP